MLKLFDLIVDLNISNDKINETNKTESNDLLSQILIFVFVKSVFSSLITQLTVLIYDDRSSISFLSSEVDRDSDNSRFYIPVIIVIDIDTVPIPD